MTSEREAMTLERQAFEKWAQSLPAESMYDFNEDGRGYKKPTGEMMWQAWQAAVANLSRAAEPVYQHRRKGGEVRKWFDCSKEEYEAMGRSEHDCANFDRRILYTHPPEPARDAKDAARYRWLRERVEVKREGGFWWLAEMEGGFPCTEDFTGNLDTEIDAAMAQESGDE